MKHFGWDGKEETKHLFRKTLQDVGRIGREISKDFWVKKLGKKLWSIPCDTFIVADARYDREITGLKEYFEKYNYIAKATSGTTIDIKVIQLDRRFESNLSEEELKDSSEQGISPHLVDVFIDLDLDDYYDNPVLKRWV